MSTIQHIGGALLSFGGITSPPSYAPLGGCKDIKGPDGSVTVLDSTTQDITDNTKRKLGALIDEGKLTVTVWEDWGDTSGQVVLMKNKGAVGYFQLAPKNYSPAVTLTFTAVISKVGHSYKIDGEQAFDLELDITAPVVKTP